MSTPPFTVSHTARRRKRSAGRIATSFRAGQDQYLAASRSAVEALFGPVGERHFAVRYWTGDEDVPAGRAPAFQLILTWPGALRRMCLPPSELSFAEAFIRGDYNIRGEVAAASAVALGILERLRSPARLARLLAALMRLPRVRMEPTLALTNSVAASRRTGPVHHRERNMAAIRHHYDVGNAFYVLWLDREMVYSCAYFRSGRESIDTAQEAKLDHICRKLRLRPGERLLDIGCGWGALIRHAAKHYGVEAVGVTLSAAQAELARERIAADGLESVCRVEVRDYRDLPPDEPFDKVASIGMSEHVGRSQQAKYFAAAHRLTKPGGLFLNHCIVSLEDARPRTLVTSLARRLWRQGAFIDRYVFPDGELVTLAESTAAAERSGYESRDFESLREHYALTLRHWVRRLEHRSDEARALVGEARLRVWRLYMAASEQAFRSGRIGVVQMLLARPDETGTCSCPPTRDDVYQPFAATR